MQLMKSTQLRIKTMKQSCAVNYSQRDRFGHQGCLSSPVLVQTKGYGILKMVQGESPRIMFDTIMGRFEDDYSRNIFYYASCRLKEFGMNREPKRFQDLLITTDPVHCVNHTT